VIPFAKDEVSASGSGDRKTDALEDLAAVQVLVWLAIEGKNVAVAALMMSVCCRYVNALLF
jgi:hypothetical protein